MQRAMDAREKAIEALAMMEWARTVALYDRVSRFLADRREPSTADTLKDILSLVEEALAALRWREDLPEALAAHTYRPRDGIRLRRACVPGDREELFDDLRNRPWNPFTRR